MNGYVLAGGASRRMGTDKARLPRDGWPFAVHLCGLLESLGLRAVLVRRAPDDGLPWVHPDGRPVDVLLEPDDGSRHPLCGVVAALVHAAGPALIVPCDLPELTADDLRPLLAGPCATDHPLVAHLPASRLDRARALRAADAPARALTEGLPRAALRPAALVDRNAGGGPWPAERLAARLAWLGSDAVGRALVGERVRQRARGVLDPSAPGPVCSATSRENG